MLAAMDLLQTLLRYFFFYTGQSCCSNSIERLSCSSLSCGEFALSRYRGEIIAIYNIVCTSVS